MNRDRHDVITGLFIWYHHEQPAMVPNDYLAPRACVIIALFAES